MVHRIAGDRKSPAFDGVRENHARPVRLSIALLETVKEQGDVVSAKIGDEFPERRIVVVLDERDEV